MTWLIPLLLAFTVFTTLVSLYMGMDRMRHYMPVLANLVRSDYSVTERHYDKLGTEFSDGISKLKLVTMRMEFTTAKGQEVRASHKRWTVPGDMQKSCYSLWYNCDDPEKTTAYGPGTWLLVAMVSACLMVTLFLDPAGWLELFGSGPDG